MYGQTHIYTEIQFEKNDSLKCEKLIDASEYYKFQNVDTLLLIANDLIKTAEKLNSNRFLETGYSIKSLGLKFKGEFGMATDYAQKALDINSRSGTKINKAKILLNYADLLRQQKQYDICEKYHREGIDISKSENDSTLLARYYINTGLMFADMGKLDSAFQYYNQGIVITNKFKDLRKTGITARLNLSALASKQKNYKEMIRLADEVYKYGVQENDADHISLGAINVSSGYLGLEQYDKALEYIRYAEDAAQKYNSPQNLLYALGTASDIYAEKGDYKSALEKALSYIGLKDSLRTALYDRNLMEMTTKYELKEKENLLAEHTITIQKQATRQRVLLLISIILLLSVTLIFQYLKRKQELKRKNAEVEAERARMAAQLEHIEVEKLREMDQVKSNFFANISHEFRTPLTLIISPIEQMLSGYSGPDYKKYLGNMLLNAQRLLNLVNQLLDLSKLESGKLALTVSSGDLPQFIRAVAGSFESLAQKKQIDYKIETEPLADQAWFDHDVLEKILTNLISNAFKFTDDGGEIAVKLIRKNDEVQIIVKDNGGGIKSEHLDNLFERFTHSTSSVLQEGSGIGLALTKELTLHHKGSIYVQSQVGIGSEFVITLNVNKNNYAPTEIVDNTISHAPNANIRELYDDSRKNMNLFTTDADKKPSLLIAEDNEDVRAYIRDICKSDYDITETANGKQAFQMAKEIIPDIIISDVMMPEMDGNELCQKLKSDDKTSHIPVVLLTARADSSDKIEGLTSGADDYLVKPFNARELLTRLNNLILQRRQLHEHYRKVLHAFSPQLVREKSMDTHFLQNVRSVIESNMENETFGVTELSEMIGLSRSQLHRKLSSLTGLSPNEVIRNMRLEKAKMLIEQKTGTISEIAYRCGFNSPAYFSKCYKDYFGHTAGEDI